MGKLTREGSSTSRHPLKPMAGGTDLVAKPTPLSQGLNCSGFKPSSVPIEQPPFRRKLVSHTRLSATRAFRQLLLSVGGIALLIQSVSASKKCYWCNSTEGLKDCTGYKGKKGLDKHKKDFKVCTANICSTKTGSRDKYACNLCVLGS